MAKTKTKIKKSLTVDDLAAMINRRFDESDNVADSRFKTIIDRFERVESDIKDIKITLGPLVSIAAEHERKMINFDARISRLEREAGILHK